MNLEFSFSKNSFHTKAKEPCLPYYFTHSRREDSRIQTFPRAIMWNANNPIQDLNLGCHVYFLWWYPLHHEHPHPQLSMCLCVLQHSPDGSKCWIDDILYCHSPCFMIGSISFVVSSHSWFHWWPLISSDFTVDCWPHWYFLHPYREVVLFVFFQFLVQKTNQNIFKTLLKTLKSLKDIILYISWISGQIVKRKF